mgnify:CR=1
MEQQTNMEVQGTIDGIHHHTPLTSSELACLWRTNNYYTMLKCFFKQLLYSLGDID